MNWKKSDKKLPLIFEIGRFKMGWREIPAVIAIAKSGHIVIEIDDAHYYLVLNFVVEHFENWVVRLKANRELREKIRRVKPQ